MIALLLLLGAAPPGPSFDCARAASPAEKAICADPALAALDRGLAQAWAGARGRLKGDAPALAALKHDQELFLYARDLVMEGKMQSLEAFLAGRVQLLESLAPAPPALPGRYVNLHGTITLKARPDGGLDVDATGLEPSRGSWICEQHAAARPAADGAFVAPAAPDAWGLRLRREGSALVVEELPSGDGVQRHHCGHRGMLDGRYLWAGPA